MSIRPALSLLALALAASRADAHNLGIECKIQGDAVRIEAFYDDDTPCQNARVKIEDESKAIISEGKTDDRGLWSFARPKPGRYSVHVNDGAGHVAKVAMTVPEGSAEVKTTERENVSPKHATVSEGPSRSDFTRFPWLPLAAGLAVIAVIAVAAFVAMKLLRR